MNERSWRNGIILGVFLISAVAYANKTVEPVYQDVLDTPAQMSSLAASTQLNSIVLSGNRLIAVGHRGHIVYSDDQGKKWIQCAVPVSSDLVSVSFPTEKSGWAVGHDGVVLHTADAGVTWVKQFDGLAAAQVMSKHYAETQNSPGSDSIRADVQRYLEQGADKPFLDVWFESDSKGYIVGAFGLIFRTMDGGKSWIPLFDRIDNPKRYHLYAIKAIGSDLFICGEQGGVYKLDTVADRFKEIKTPYAGTYFGISGKPGALLVYGMRGKVFRSSDGGGSWRQIETGVPAGITGATILEDGRFVLVSQIGHVLISNDDGMTFKPVNTDSPIPAAAVTALAKDTLMVVGFKGAHVVSSK